VGRALPFLLLLLANGLWGSSLVVAKLALGELTPLQVAAWRMIVAGLVVLPWLLRRQAWGGLPARAWPGVALVGLLGFAVSKFLQMWGLNLTTALDTSLLVAMEPLLTIALGALVLREALSGRRLAAFAVGAAGAWLLMARGLALPAPGSAHVLGDGAFLLGLACEAGLSVVGKALLARYPATLVTAGALAAALGLWLPVAVGDGLLAGWPALDGGTLAAIAYLALGCTVFAYWAWFRALAELEAGRVALTLFVQPLWGAALAMAVLGEPLRPATLAGGALVLASLYLALVPGRARPGAPRAARRPRPRPSARAPGAR
jgi:drug/metabolite transporter (DMT)-like permease